MNISTNESNSNENSNNYSNNTCLNFMELINRDNTMTLNYKSKFMDKLKEEFTEEEQNLYVANLYIYLHFDDNDFAINLENVYKWIGYSNKGNAKRTLVNNFTLETDYKILLINEDKNNNENQLLTKEKLGGSGLNNEKIMLKIDTFKELCLLSKAGKVVRKYYIQLEKINNFLAKEQLLEAQEKQRLLEKELESSKNLIKEKEKVINNMIEEKDHGYIYIGHDPAIENLTKIGVSIHILERKDTHNTSNSSFVYTYTYKSVNYKHIEHYCKILCKSYLKNKNKTQSEWYNMNPEQMQEILNFCIMTYDDYDINGHISNLVQFVNNFKRTKLISSISSKHVFFQRDIYEKFVNDCIVMNESDKCPLTLVQRDFETWINDNNYETTFGIRNVNGNYYNKFTEEISKYIDDITNCKKQQSMNLLSKLRNFNFSNMPGWTGFELKSMKIKTYNYFSLEVYNEFINETLEETKRKNVTQAEVVLSFLDWNKIKKYEYKKPIYYSKTSKDVILSFKQELRECILIAFPNSEYKISVGTTRHLCTSGFTNLRYKI